MHSSHNPGQPGVEHVLGAHEEVSAGGIVVDVVDGAAMVAIISRRNRKGKLEWCLPKGHIEGAETAPQTAMREIEEETGITSKIVRHLGTVDYWFTGDEDRIHKVVHHYLLAATGGELTAENDPDGEVEQVEWVPLLHLKERLAYPNERRLAGEAQRLLVETA